jgi:hypothetical protein
LSATLAILHDDECVPEKLLTLLLLAPTLLVGTVSAAQADPPARRVSNKRVDELKRRRRPKKGQKFDPPPRSASKLRQSSTLSAEGELDMQQNGQPSTSEQPPFTPPGKYQRLPSSSQLLPLEDCTFDQESAPSQPNYSHKRQKVCGGGESLSSSPPVTAANLDHGNQDSQLPRPSARKLHAKKAASVLHISDELKTWVPPPFEPAEPSAAPSSKTGERSSAGEQPAVQKSLSSPVRSPGLSTEGLPIVAPSGSYSRGVTRRISRSRPASKKVLLSFLRPATPDAEGSQVAALPLYSEGGVSRREVQPVKRKVQSSPVRRGDSSTGVSQAVTLSSSSSGDSSRRKPQPAKKAKLSSPEPRTQGEAQTLHAFRYPSNSSTCSDDLDQVGKRHDQEVEFRASVVARGIEITGEAVLETSPGQPNGRLLLGVD